MRGSGYTDWVRVDDQEVTRETEHATRVIRDAALRWWRETPAPRFLVVSTQVPHSPFHDPPPDLTPQRDRELHPVETDDDRYLAMLQSLDTILAAVRAELGADDWLFFLADNGTPPATNGNKGRGKKTTFERGVRVPLVVAGPGIGRPGARTAALTSCVDLYATIAELAGASRPDGVDGGEDAVSFAGAFAAGADWAGARAWVMSEWFDPTAPERNRDRDLMIRDERWKLRQVGDARRRKNREFLYDLAADPEEQAALGPAGRGRAVPRGSGGLRPPALAAGRAAGDPARTRGQGTKVKGSALVVPRTFTGLRRKIRKAWSKVWPSTPAATPAGTVIVAVARPWASSRP